MQIAKLFEISRSGFGFLVAHWAVLGLSLTAALPPEASEKGPTICPVKLTTGHDCPGCGITRAVAYSLHGEWDKAQVFNRAVWIVTPLLIAIALHQLLCTAQYLPFVARATPRWLKARPYKFKKPQLAPQTIEAIQTVTVAQAPAAEVRHEPATEVTEVTETLHVSGDKS